MFCVSRHATTGNSNRVMSRQWRFFGNVPSGRSNHTIRTNGLSIAHSGWNNWRSWRCCGTTNCGCQPFRGRRRGGRGTTRSRHTTIHGMTVTTDGRNVDLTTCSSGGTNITLGSWSNTTTAGSWRSRRMCSRRPTTGRTTKSSHRSGSILGLPIGSVARSSNQPATTTYHSSSRSYGNSITATWLLCSFVGGRGVAVYGNFAVGSDNLDDLDNYFDGGGTCLVVTVGYDLFV